MSEDQVAAEGSMNEGASQDMGLNSHEVIEEE